MISLTELENPRVIAMPAEDLESGRQPFRAEARRRAADRAVVVGEEGGHQADADVDRRDPLAASAERLAEEVRRSARNIETALGRRAA